MFEDDIEREREILRQATEGYSYIHRKIVADPDNPNQYLVFLLSRGGKFHCTLAGYDNKDLLRSLESLNARKNNGEFESFRIKVSGELLDGEDKYFRDVGELIEALKLKQGVEAKVLDVL